VVEVREDPVAAVVGVHARPTLIRQVVLLEVAVVENRAALVGRAEELRLSRAGRFQTEAELSEQMVQLEALAHQQVEPVVMGQVVIVMPQPEAGVVGLEEEEGGDPVEPYGLLVIT
jgi:hypothetical protein